MVDIFKKLDEAKAEKDPFPYIVIEDFLPQDLCQALLREMPPLHVLTHGRPPGDNKRFNLSYADAVSDGGISQLWREVLAQAVSQTFLDRILRVFEPSIREFYPDFERRFAPLSELKAEPRLKALSAPRQSKGSRQPGSIMLDAQIAVNTPALTGGQSVRTPHLDRTDKIFIGLLYLRLPQDDSKGADLELLSPKEGEHLVYGHQRMLPAEQTILVRTIPYRCNTLVLVLNTPKSIHGVTPRQQTPHPRFFINLVGETCEPLFEVDMLPRPEPFAPSSGPWPAFIRRASRRALLAYSYIKHPRQIMQRKPDAPQTHVGAVDSPGMTLNGSGDTKAGTVS